MKRTRGKFVKATEVKGGDRLKYTNDHEGFNICKVTETPAEIIFWIAEPHKIQYVKPEPYAVGWDETVWIA